MKLLAYAVLIILSLSFGSIAIECPKMPEQTNKEWDVQVQAAVGRIGPVKGAELETRTRNAVKDLMGKLPDADKVYLEQMMYATYCSALRDDTTLSESEKASRIRAYNLEVRRTLYKVPDRPGGDKQPPPVDKRMEARLRLSQMSLPYTTNAFVESAKKGDVDVVKLYLAAGMDPNTRDDDGNTVLRHAVMKGHREVVDVLLKARAGVNERNKSGWTPLSAAANPDKKDILSTLLKQRPDVHALNSAFLSAASNADREILAILKQKGADVRAAWEGMRVIDLALCNTLRSTRSVTDEKLNGTVAYLLDLGADVNARLTVSNGMTPLLLAVENGYQGIVKILLDRGADPNMRWDCNCSYHRFTPLMLAAWRSGRGPEHRMTIVNNLLDKGADINATCDVKGQPCYGGSSALMFAAEAGTARVSVAEILINRNADVNVRNEKGESALHLAARHGGGTMKRLLDRGCDINQRDSLGDTALMNASHLCNVDSVTLLLDRGADVNMKNNDGENALMLAIRRCGQETRAVPLLLEKGTDVNARTTEGKTALMIAAEQGQIETVKALLGRGADVNQKTLYGKSALDFAESNKLKGENREKLLWLLKTAEDTGK